MNLTKEDLETLPTLHQGHFDNLKIETDTLRIWVSRVDGSITKERLIDGRWETV